MNRISTIEWDMPHSIKRVWETVTDNKDFSWRSDLEKIEIKTETKFTEITKSGEKTEFEIIEKKPYEIYKFKMGNNFFQGDWTGKFIEITPESTKLIFTEELNIKNPIIWLLSFFMMKLHQIQKTYMEDLQEKLDKSK